MLPLALALALALCLARASTAQEQPACDAPSSAGDAAACEPLREEFLDWLNEGGAKIHPALEIRVSEQSGRRGLHTNAPLDEGTELASVPRKLWLDEAVALESPVGDLIRTIKEKAKSMPAHIPTVIWLVHERLLGKRSPLASYVRYLPKYEELAAGFGDEARKLLLAGTAPGVSNRLVHNVWHDGDLEYTMLDKQIFDPRPALFPQTPPGAPPGAKSRWRLRGAYNWAVATMSSRSISPETNELTAVVPFLDLLNHDKSAADLADFFDISHEAQPPGWEVSEQVDSMKMLANRPYEAGEELFTAYENASISTWPVARYPSCHEHMLIRYGFTDGATARDCFHIFVDPEEFMQPSDPEDEAEGEDYRLGILAQENLGPRPIYIWAIHSDLHGMIASAVKTLRILMLPSMTELKNGADTAVDEVLVWKTLQRLVREQGKAAVAAGDADAALEAAKGQVPDATVGALRQWFGTATQGMARVQKKIEKRCKSNLRKLKRGEELPESEGHGGQVAYQKLDQPPGTEYKDPFGEL